MILQGFVRRLFKHQFGGGCGDGKDNYFTVSLTALKPQALYGTSMVDYASQDFGQVVLSLVKSGAMSLMTALVTVTKELANGQPRDYTFYAQCWESGGLIARTTTVKHRQEN